MERFIGGAKERVGHCAPEERNGVEITPDDFRERK